MSIKNYSAQGSAKWVVAGELKIATGGKFIMKGRELKPAAAQAESSATTIAALRDDVNELITKLKEAGLME